MTRLQQQMNELKYALKHRLISVNEYSTLVCELHKKNKK